MSASDQTFPNDSASDTQDFESVGRRFESCQARQKYQALSSYWVECFLFLNFSHKFKVVNHSYGIKVCSRHIESDFV